MTMGLQMSKTIRRRFPQSGVTLVETLLVVTISSLIMVPMLGWAIMAMREKVDTNERNVDSASIGLLRTYFIRDVASADAAHTGAAAAGTDCTGGGGEAQVGAETLLKLETGSTSYIVYNQTTDSEGTGTSVWRRECDGATLIESAEMVSRVDPSGTTMTCLPRSGAAASDCGRINFKVTTVAGEAVSMTATVRTGDAVSAPAGPVYVSPVVNIVVSHPDPLYRGQTVTFDASSTTDPTGGTLSHNWDFGDGTTSSDEVATHAYTTLGEFTAIYTATNEDGTPASDYDRVLVENRPPTAVISAPSNGSSTYRCTNMTFGATGSNDSGDSSFGGSVASYKWDYGDGTTSTRASAANHTHQFARLSPNGGQNPLNVSLVVTDNDGGDSVAETRSVTVANRAPSAFSITGNGNSSNVSANGPVTVNFASTATDLDLCATSDETLSYEWDFGDGSPVSTSAAPSHTFTSGGTYKTKLKVTDGSGATRTSSNEISVVINGIPTSAFSLASYDVRAGSDLSTPNWITNSSSDPEGDPLTYKWTFQNVTSPSGGTSTAATPSPVRFTHNVGGSDVFIGATYNVTLEVKDPLGATATSTRQVVVRGAPAPGNFRKTGGGCQSSSWGTCDERYINFAWNSVSQVDQYQIHLWCSSIWPCSKDIYPTYSGSTTSVKIQGLQNNILYAYWYHVQIRARDSVTGKWGPWSSTIDVNDN